MKIDERNQLGLMISDKGIQRIYEEQLHNIKVNSSTKEIEDRVTIMLKNLMSNDKNRNVVFTQTAIADVNKIKIDKFEAKIFSLEHVKENKLTFLINENLYYKVDIRDNYIYIMILKRNKSETNDDIFNYTFFTIIPEENRVVFSTDPNYWDNKEFQLIIRLLIFYEYSKTNIIFKSIAPNKKYDKSLSDRYVNKSETDITIVDSTWNKIISVSGKFTVCGHFRLQPCGIGHMDRELIFINEFEKNGYTRRAGKELANTQ